MIENPIFKKIENRIEQPLNDRCSDSAAPLPHSPARNKNEPKVPQPTQFEEQV